MLVGTLDLKTKEAIALAVFMANRCSYCINSHSMALRRLGFTDGQLVELAAVVDFLSSTNVFSSGLKI